ncbi:MAG TPA: hypothetical protein VFH33_08105, partial [Candidatus Krumholzibacteria bacterium]|nr:hypothetical protein [Candidatus Krumholzibacteria bacterium]
DDELAPLAGASEHRGKVLPAPEGAPRGHDPGGPGISSNSPSTTSPEENAGASSAMGAWAGSVAPAGG